MRNSRLDVRPLSGAGGAEIFGVDVAQDLDDATVGVIRDALNQHCVVFFRDQTLDVARHKAFARRFGPIFIHPNYGSLSDDPEIVMIRREPGDAGHIGEEWHIDTTMCAEPPMGAILYGIDVPPYGGDTLFANQYLAYEALSPAMKKMLEGLRAVHSDITEAGPVAAAKNRNRSTRHRDDDTWRETRNLHPIVRTNRETGRRCLFVNAANTIGIEGMTEAESRPLLGFLLEHGHRPEFTFRFRWQKGSIAFWDNRSTKHIALGDTGPFRRLMRRIQISGDAPV
jgi:taurine dioxygenase